MNMLFNISKTNKHRIKEVPIRTIEPQAMALTPMDQLWQGLVMAQAHLWMPDGFSTS